MSIEILYCHTVTFVPIHLPSSTSQKGRSSGQWESAEQVSRIKVDKIISHTLIFVHSIGSIELILPLHIPSRMSQNGNVSEHC